MLIITEKKLKSELLVFEVAILKGASEAIKIAVTYFICNLRNCPNQLISNIISNDIHIPQNSYKSYIYLAVHRY